MQAQNEDHESIKSIINILSEMEETCEKAAISFDENIREEERMEKILKSSLETSKKLEKIHPKVSNFQKKVFYVNAPDAQQEINPIRAEEIGIF
jgi:hypothetical protein